MACNRVYLNEIPVWTVSLKNKRTGKTVDLEITARNNEEATQKCSSLYSDYQWTGTGPLYVETN
ncbi:MAG TPA: hypothetical protein VFD28_00655 [Candidatus Eisenbacteria bacterium]|nr:hypothetical protein [Candidatus Eisenbacteria bacterium]